MKSIGVNSMDLFVRRQSEQLGRHFSESYDDEDDNDRSNKKKFREIYDYRRWEWGNLRVIQFDFSFTFHRETFIIRFMFYFFHFYNPIFVCATKKKTECENLGLETFYRTYVQRLQRSYLSIFFVMHTIIGMAHTIVLFATQVSGTVHFSNNFYTTNFFFYRCC